MLFYLASAIAFGMEPVPVTILEPGDTAPVTVVQSPPTAYWTSAADVVVQGEAVCQSVPSEVPRRIPIIHCTIPDAQVLSGAFLHDPGVTPYFVLAEGMLGYIISGRDMVAWMRIVDADTGEYEMARDHSYVYSNGIFPEHLGATLVEYVPHSLIVSGPSEMVEDPASTASTASTTDTSPELPPTSLMVRETIVMVHEEDPTAFGGDAWAAFVQSVSEGH